jgi:hypothetical protein
MIVADGLSSVIEGESYARESLRFRTPVELGIAPERVALYRQRMSAAGCPRIDVRDDGAVVFAVASWGLANRGWRVALVWTKTPPTPLVPTIDGFRKTRPARTWESATSPLGGDWYATIIW